jgi:hypothetical protein
MDIIFVSVICCGGSGDFSHQPEGAAGIAAPHSYSETACGKSAAGRFA